MDAIAVRQEIRRVVAPLAELSVDQWADQFRMLDEFTSSEPGRWKTSRTPYLRQVMKDFTDPGIEELVMVASTQVGKTEAIVNMIGFCVDQDPGPAMVVLPRDEDAKAWAMKRCRGAFEVSPRLALHLTGREDDVQGKLFTLDRMYLKFAGANSPADLVSDPCRYVFFDEVDKYPRFSGKETSPLRLGRKRTTTFWNRKIVEASTPTFEDAPIWASLMASQFHRYLVPCPRCGAYQAIGFRRTEKDRIKWSTARAASIVWPKNARANEMELGTVPVWMECAECRGKIEETEKTAMVAAGVWCPEGCDVQDGRVIGKVDQRARKGYHIPATISPWVGWWKIATDFLKARDTPDGLMDFVNNTLAEPWQDAQIERVDAHPLMGRREVYPEDLPAGVMFLTCGVDVQKDRIEYEVVGWGRGFESWSLEYDALMGSTIEGKVWKELDARLNKRWANGEGVNLSIARTFVDSSYLTATVYAWVRRRQVRNVFAIKGEDGEGRPVAKWSKTQRRSTGIHLCILGVDTAKDQVFGWLKMEERGPGYCHFPMYGEEYFLMLTAERQTITRKDGYAIRGYEKVRDRNEALDCRVMAYAAASSFPPATLKRFVEEWESSRRAIEYQREAAETVMVEAQPVVNVAAERDAIVEETSEEYQREKVLVGPKKPERQPFPRDLLRRLPSRRFEVKRW